jgi:hypothetical protein
LSSSPTSLRGGLAYGSGAPAAAIFGCRLRVTYGKLPARGACVAQVGACARKVCRFMSADESGTGLGDSRMALYRGAGTHASSRNSL